MTSLFETAPERSAEVMSRVPEHEKAGTCPPEKTRESAKPHAVTDPGAAGREARANEFVLNKGQLTETQKRGHVVIGLGKCCDQILTGTSPGIRSGRSVFAISVFVATS